MVQPRQTLAHENAWRTEAQRAVILASVFQEVFTVVVRLRAGRLPVTNERDFRRQVIALLKTSHANGREHGYSDPAVNQAMMVTVAFLDESVLDSEQREFAEWRGNPLQLELYGHARMGEVFFENLKKLMAQDDNAELADVLEVFYLCLLLGFRGRYAVAGVGDLESLCSALQKRIQRIRPSAAQISSNWILPREKQLSARGMSAVRRLIVITAVFVVTTLLLFVGFKLYLRSSVADLGAPFTNVSK